MKDATSINPTQVESLVNEDQAMREDIDKPISSENIEARETSSSLSQPELGSGPNMTLQEVPEKTE